MEFHGSSSKILEFCGNSNKNPGIPWNAAKIPWEFHPSPSQAGIPAPKSWNSWNSKWEFPWHGPGVGNKPWEKNLGILMRGFIPGIPAGSGFLLRDLRPQSPGRNFGKIGGI